MSDSQARFKKQAAEAALDQLSSGMTVGLGTGSTAAFVISGLGERLADGRLTDIRAVATSLRTEELARQAGIELTELTPAGLDIAIDGCDEVDPQLQLIKGLGGALTREKLVALAARRFVIVADDSKAVDRLGSLAPVPVEVVGFGHLATVARLELLVGECRQRSGADGQPLISDNGNLIFDFYSRTAFSPLELAADLKAETGVVEHGLFLGLADEAILAGPDGITRRVHP